MLQKIWNLIRTQFIRQPELESIDLNDRKFEKIFYLVAGGWLVLWTLLPTFCVGNAFIDVSENFAWGQHFQFGYDKNPYVGAWLTYWSYRLIPLDFTSYLLSQCSVLVAVISVWKLGLDVFKSRFHALLGVLLMLLVPYYSYSACELNDDVIEISLWALFILFYYRAITKQRLLDWLITGIAAGLAFMTKYLGPALFIPLGALTLFTSEGRQSWRKSGIYLAGVAFLALSLPNLIWLYHNDFIAFRYATGRASLNEAVPLFRHVTNPLNLLFLYVAKLILPAIGTWLIFRPGQRRLTSDFNLKYLVLASTGPIVLSILFSIVTGGKVYTSWTTPYYITSGLLLVALARPLMNRQRLKFFLAGFCVFTVISAIMFGGQYLVKTPYLRKKISYEAFPGQVSARYLTTEWRQRYECPLKYVIGERRESCNVSYYSPDHPVAFFDASVKLSQWIDPADVEREGAVLFWESNSNPGWLNNFRDRLVFLPELEFQRAVAPWFKVIAGDTPTLRFRVAFLPPEKYQQDKVSN